MNLFIYLFIHSLQLLRMKIDYVRLNSVRKYVYLGFSSICVSIFYVIFVRKRINKFIQEKIHTRQCTYDKIEYKSINRSINILILLLWRYLLLVSVVYVSFTFQHSSLYTMLIYSIQRESFKKVFFIKMFVLIYLLLRVGGYFSLLLLLLLFFLLIVIDYTRLRVILLCRFSSSSI